MSRHSKWSKVKQFKGAIDAKRSASFTKLAREITVAAKEKGGDPAMNARLRAAIEHAREGSMPKENIERAIQRGAGGESEGQIEALTYEAYAPGGIALMIECLTDNRNRTASEVKHILSKHEGAFASSGSVSYLFDRRGVVRLSEKLSADRHDEIELSLIDAGALNVIDEEEGTEIQSEPQDLSRAIEVLESYRIKYASAEFEWIPKNLVEANEMMGTRAVELIEELENNDDIQRVFSNLA